MAAASSDVVVVPAPSSVNDCGWSLFLLILVVIELDDLAGAAAAAEITHPLISSNRATTNYVALHPARTTSLICILPTLKLLAVSFCFSLIFQLADHLQQFVLVISIQLAACLTMLLPR